MLYNKEIASKKGVPKKLQKRYQKIDTFFVIICF
jgi:hypothetical protein